MRYGFWITLRLLFLDAFYMEKRWVDRNVYKLNSKFKPCIFVQIGDLDIRAFWPIFDIV